MSFLWKTIQNLQLNRHKIFENLPNNNDPNLEFYLVDMSLPALNFAQRAGLCEDSFCINLEKEQPSSKFQQVIHDIDLVISTRCVGYIGEESFAKIFHNLEHTDESFPIFAFTALRIFQMDKINKVFADNHFDLIKTKIGPLKQRMFYNKAEMEDTLNLLKSRNMDTSNLGDAGHYFADFYVGGPKTLKSVWMSWIQNLEDVFVPIQG